MINFVDDPIIEVERRREYVGNLPELPDDFIFEEELTEVGEWDKVESLVINPTTICQEAILKLSDCVIRFEKYMRSRPKLRMPISTQEVYIWQRDGMQCVYCDRQLLPYSATSRGEMYARNSRSNSNSPDHVVPAYREGLTVVRNLVTCCKPCNFFKSTRLPSDFLLDLYSPGGFERRDQNWQFKKQDFALQFGDQR
ncbi:MAG TPA: HNH endonuclease signature motif containing protein [Patescibacteria group bacterium]|nr:HNH endonuclease signature motif containing protein [Patescibacteria group bacterium]